MLIKALTLIPALLCFTDASETSPDSRRGVLLDRIWVNKCSPEEGCTEVTHPANTKYTPYNVVNGERLADRVDVNFRKKTLFMTLRRPARVSVCLKNKLHKNSFQLPEEAAREGWSVYPGLIEGSVKRVPGKGRVKTLGGLHDCGQTLFKDYYQDRTPSVVIPPIKMKTVVYLEERDATSILPVPRQSDVRPNELCPDWVQDEYTARDHRDGRIYKTYHPQFHPIYYCSLGHEHGSDPAQLGTITYPDGNQRTYQPTFGFTAYYNDQQNEPNIGFKGYVIKGKDVNLYINAHTTSSALSRACARFHTLVLAGFDSRTGDMLFELNYKADFGSAVTNVKDKDMEGLENLEDQIEASMLKMARIANGDDEDDDNYDIEIDEDQLFGYADAYEDEEDNEKDRMPRKTSLSRFQDAVENILSDKLNFLDLSCADQSAITADCNRRGKNCSFRRLRTLDLNKGYEGWRTGSTDLVQFPSKLTFDIRQPITGCMDFRCEELYLTKHDGTKRTIALRKGLVVRSTRQFDSDGDGYFVTDQYGTFLRDINLSECRRQAGGCASNLELIQFIRRDASVGQCDKVEEGTNCLESPSGVFASENVYTGEYLDKDTLQNKPRALTVMNALKLGADPNCDLQCAHKKGGCVCYRN